MAFRRSAVRLRSAPPRPDRRLRRGAPCEEASGASSAWEPLSPCPLQCGDRSMWARMSWIKILDFVLDQCRVRLLKSPAIGQADLLVGRTDSIVGSAAAEPKNLRGCDSGDASRPVVDSAVLTACLTGCFGRA